MVTIQMRIAMTEAEPVVEAAEGDIVAKLKAAMSVTRNHWACTNEDQQFRSAIGAVMLHYGEGSEEFNRLKEEMAALQTVSAMINAAQAGVSVDFGSLADIGTDFEPIGIMKLWQQEKHGKQ
jgi:hypothetical protein